MSDLDEAVGIVRSWYETSDVTLLANGVEWRVLDHWPAGGLYRGRDAVRDEFFPKLLGRFAEYRVEVASVLAVRRNIVLGLGRYHGRVRADDQPFEARFAHLWKVEAGRIAGFEQIADTAAVQAALLASTPTPHC